VIAELMTELKPVCEDYAASAPQIFRNKSASLGKVPAAGFPPADGAEVLRAFEFILVAGLDNAQIGSIGPALPRPTEGER
jgi:hypothetical protein